MVWPKRAGRRPLVTNSYIDMNGQSLSRRRLWIIHFHPRSIFFQQWPLLKSGA